MDEGLRRAAPRMVLRAVWTHSFKKDDTAQVVLIDTELDLIGMRARRS